mmetsp:Transcript_60426/g.132255  ORF Transcript_60426/g.132255 Transcript_60426/m.132255 type:complete len:336 (+) Transcript_60426:2320-3327(+)
MILFHVRKLQLVLFPDHCDTVRNVLHELVVGLRIGILLLFLGGVLQSHALAEHVSHLELPGCGSWHVFHIDQIDPSFHSAGLFLAFAIKHVLDQVGCLELLLGVQSHGILLALFLLVVLALVFVFFVVLLVFVVFLVLFVFLVLVILFVLLVFFVLVFLGHGRAELAEDLFDVLQRLLEREVLDVREALALGFFELRSDASPPEPVREVQRGQDPSPAELRFLVGYVHRAPVLLLFGSCSSCSVLLFLLAALALRRAASLLVVFLLLTVVSAATFTAFSSASLEHLEDFWIIFVFIIVLVGHSDCLGPSFHPEFQVLVCGALFGRHGSLHRLPLY